jgi:hypothetical protein
VLVRGKWFSPYHQQPQIYACSPAGETLEELILIAEAGIASDYQDRIEYLPVT